MAAQNYAIRFGLGAIKAVGLGIMEAAVAERKKNGKFKDIYDFATRLEARYINKKLIEALAKSGAFDDIVKNRRQIFESFEILSAFALEKKEEASSNQMSLFGGLIDEAASKPALKPVENWNKEERLQKEFEAFGFFLNEHPLDDYVHQLKCRGVVFSDKIERDEFEDNNIVKMAGVVASSKHRSSARGRFAYVMISDPFGMFEAMIFDEEIITNARDLLDDGSPIAITCLIRKDEGGIRILVREVNKLDDFIKVTEAKKEPFEDIKKQAQRKNRREGDEGSGRDWSKENSGKERNFVKKESGPSAYQQRLAQMESKNIYLNVEIIFNSIEPIIPLKAALSQLLAPDNFAKKTKVIFNIKNNEKESKIALGPSYLIDEADVTRLKKIAKIIDIKAN